MELESFQIVKILTLSATAFVLAFVLAPLLIKLLNKWGIGKSIRGYADVPIFSKLHLKKEGTPTMGGILIWGTVFLLVVVFSCVANNFPNSIFADFNFLSRKETLLPLGALIASAIVGFVDDYIDVKKLRGVAGGLRMRHRLLIYTLIAVVGAWWFSAKLDWDLLHVPFLGDFNIGLLYIPFFIFVIVSTAFSVNESDGLDGLAGGTLFAGFGAYTIIAFAQGRYDLAALCGVIIGALLAFLWFNIHPARFIMGDTGAMALGVTLGIVALLTNSALLLPLIGIVYVIESLSVIGQVIVRKTRKKKWLKSAPLHHHLEAIGWQEPKIVMRFWIISFVFAALGVVVALLDALVT
ncbi:MAG: phospho-N-acetylmuramoyl-pentapeptide-transferase [Patescibacteria group bacterium]